MVAGASGLVAAVAAAQSLALVFLGYLLKSQGIGGVSTPTTTTTTSTPAADEPPLCPAAPDPEPGAGWQLPLGLVLGALAGFGFAVLLALTAGGVCNIGAWLASSALAGGLGRVTGRCATPQHEAKSDREPGQGSPSPLPLCWD